MRYYLRKTACIMMCCASFQLHGSVLPVVKGLTLSPRIRWKYVVEDLKMLILSRCMEYRLDISSRFSSNSEAYASELLE